MLFYWSILLTFLWYDYELDDHDSWFFAYKDQWDGMPALVNKESHSLIKPDTHFYKYTMVADRRLV